LTQKLDFAIESAGKLPVSVSADHASGQSLFIPFIPSFCFSEKEMIIRCEKCKTKFRLDDSRVTGIGIRVRCSRCRHIFVVRKERPEEEVSFGRIMQGMERSVAKSKEARVSSQESPATEPYPENPKISDDAGAGTSEAASRDEPGTEAAAWSWSAGTFGTPVPSPSFPATADGDAGSRPEPEPVRPPVDGDNLIRSGVSFDAVDQTLEAAAERCENTGGAVTEKAFQQEVEVSPESEPESGRHSEPDSAPGDTPSERTSPPVISKKSRLRRKKISSATMGLASVLTLILGAALYLSAGNLAGITTLLAGFSSPAGSGRPPIEVRNLNGKFLMNSGEGEIFVIRGDVNNRSSDVVTVSKVSGMLYGANGVEVRRKSVDAGVNVTEGELASLPPAGFEHRKGEVLVMPGRSLPFTVVLTKVPEGVVEFGAQIAAVRKK
jgi:predicted Zn finger-like uncharacterized protein